MKHIIIAFCSVLLINTSLSAQSELKKANKQYELHAFTLAIDSYRKALEKNPNNALVMARMADCYRHLNKIDKAAIWYEKAIAEGGIDPINAFNYAKILQAKGEYEKAKNWFLNYGEGFPEYGQHFARSCDFAIAMKNVPALYEVKNEYVNTASSDFGPAFYKDNVIYASSRTDMERKVNGNTPNWEGGAKNQLFFTGIDNNGFLQQPRFFKNELKNQFNQAPISISANGRWVAYTKNNFIEGTRQIPSAGMEMSIYIAEINDKGDWVNTKPFPYNGSGYSSGFPSLSADGGTMYFTSNRPDGFGGFDIFVSEKVGDTWSTPVNLGPIVNSQGNELTPYFDGQNVFFSSDWHQGFGGMDIFRTEKIDGAWSKVYHLGNGINSSGDDYGFIFDARKNVGYFTSNRTGGKGNEDIYRVNKMTNNIAINVLNASDQLPIEAASIDFSACGESVYTTDAKGNYSFQALEGLDCEVIVSKSGYASYAFKINANDTKAPQSFEILLNKESEKYIGRVVNAADNSAVVDVFIKATNQENGKRLEAQSNASGEYALALKPGVSYLLKYSKAGYIDTHINVNTGDGSNKSILGAVPFTSSITANTNTEVVNTTKPNTNTTTAVESTTAIETTSSTNTTTTSSSEATTSTNAITNDGYAIQVSAVYDRPGVNLTKYKKLQEIGPLYTKKDNGYLKVRVGAYATKEEAIRVQKSIVAKGFKKSFVIKENGAKVTAMSATPTPVPAGNSISYSRYKVRLASYKRPEFFDANKVKGIGTLEKRSWNGYTIMVLGGFTSMEEAQRARDKAVKAGFNGAHLVTDTNGKLKRVKS